MKNLLTIAAISGMLAVMFGAFGAHALKTKITPEMLEVYKTAVQYQFYHTFALLFVCVLMHTNTSNELKLSAYLFIIGIVLFSGSLYILVITNFKIIGVITPFGGIAWLIAWFMLTIHAKRSISNTH